MDMDGKQIQYWKGTILVLNIVIVIMQTTLFIGIHILPNLQNFRRKNIIISSHEMIVFRDYFLPKQSFLIDIRPI